ncbi:hypothetical protein ACUOFC_30730, partial [Escherichia sp. TWPC-MK]
LPYRLDFFDDEIDSLRVFDVDSQRTLEEVEAINLLPAHEFPTDEAARLDARSIATLFELCERLQMQLIIAAPENISPEKGTTYKLVRKVFQNTEHVHVVGLRGFAPQLPETLPGSDEAPSQAS